MPYSDLNLRNTFSTEDDLFQIEFIVKCATAAKIDGCTDCLEICTTRLLEILQKESVITITSNPTHS